MRLALDHHYATVIAEQLRAAGHDVVAAVERGWQTQDDEALLALCAGEMRALMTSNVADFAPLAREWTAQGRAHAGLLFTSDASLPRTSAFVGRYVELLGAFMSDHPGDDAAADRVTWLAG